jgi:hypothetical protein
MLCATSKKMTARYQHFSVYKTAAEVKRLEPLKRINQISCMIHLIRTLNVLILKFR